MIFQLQAVFLAHRSTICSGNFFLLILNKDSNFPYDYSRDKLSWFKNILNIKTKCIALLIKINIVIS